MSIVDLKTSHPITRVKLQTNFEVLDSKIASGLKKIINGVSKRRVCIREAAAQREKRFLTGRQVAWRGYEYFKVSGTDESVLDLNEILIVELQNDKCKVIFDTRWNETVMAMKS